MPSLLGYADGRGSLFVSEAEGFFFISGLLVALLRRRDLEARGLGLVTRRSWRRAGTLYAIACVLTLIYTGLARLAAVVGSGNAKPGADLTSSWAVVLTRTLSLHYSYGWADFLTYYVPLFLAAPLLVWLMAHRLTWLVVLMSVLAYASMSVDTAFWGPWGVFVQWQVHFVLGAVVGFHFPAILRWAKDLPPRAARRWQVVAIGAAVAVYAAGTVVLWRPSLVAGDDAVNVLLFNGRLGVLRPVCSVVMFAGGYVAITLLQSRLRALGRVLTLFGRNSMYVYILQSVAVFAIPFLIGSGGLLRNTAIDLTVIGLIYLALRRRFLFGIIPR